MYSALSIANHKTSEICQFTDCYYCYYYHNNLRKMSYIVSVNIKCLIERYL